MQALRGSKELPPTYMLLYGGPDPAQNNPGNPSAGKCSTLLYLKRPSALFEKALKIR